MTIHLITPNEYDRLVELTDGNDDIMHWEQMGTWLSDLIDGRFATYAGAISPSFQQMELMCNRMNRIGLRLTVDGLPPEMQVVPDGQLIVVGTLYMERKPVRVPQNPFAFGDIAAYHGGASILMREPLDDPDYMVLGVKDGNKAYTDCCLLNRISYNDIMFALRSQYGCSLKSSILIP